MRSSRLLVPGIFSLAASGAAKTVHIANGTIRGGKCSTTNSNYFFSIPFAQPPVGDLRLKAPVALLNTYNGTLNATTPAPSCIQFNTEFGESSNLSEDCLYLDVWAPSTATPNSNLPVRVWFYGGINAAGGISDPTYNGCYASSEAIIVSINYRVGPLGFLALSSLGLSGNYGIQDQLLGLQWVQDNIEAFGGDKNKVILHGQSAGSTDAWVISTLPQAPALCGAAAFESGGGREPVTQKKVQHWQQILLQELNCTDTDLACVLAASPDTLVSAEVMMPTPIVPAATTPFIYEGAGARWGPVIDGDIISVSPAEVGCKVPAIFGFNANEGTLFVLGEYLARSFTLNQTQYDEFLTYNFGPLASKVNETYSVEKFSSSEYPVYAAMATVFTEATYKCPAYRALSVSQTHGVPVWSYEFSHSPSCAWYKAIPQAILPYVGAAHTAEIPFVFNTTHNLPLPDGNCTFTVAEQSLAGAMSEAWTSMAEKGQPGDASEWPQWTVNSSAGVNINESMVVGTVDYSSCAFWDAIYEESAKIAEVY